MCSLISFTHKTVWYFFLIFDLNKNKQTELPSIVTTFFPLQILFPFRSTGFILDGFPRTGDEVQYLAERSLFPDIVVCLEAEEDDISDRLFTKQIIKWKEKQTKKTEKKQQIKEIKAKVRVSITSVNYIIQGQITIFFKTSQELQESGCLEPSGLKLE